MTPPISGAWARVHDHVLSSSPMALASLLGRVAPLPAQSVGLMDAAGRVLAEPVVAPRSRPVRDLAAIDGVAIRTSDLDQMAASGLEIVALLYPGEAGSQFLEPGQAARVAAGASMPIGADRVMDWDLVRVEAERAWLIGAISPFHQVQRLGSQFRAGDTLVAAGAVLSPSAIMVAAAAEATYLQVHRQPRVVLIVTGDEIAPLGDALGDAGHVPDCVSPAIGALLTHWGAQVVDRLACGDDPDLLARLLDGARDGIDMVVVIGGAGEAAHDLARAAAIQAGARILFAGLAIHPGRSTWAAERAGQILVGLPADPIGALVAARLLAAPAAAVLSGRAASAALSWEIAPTLEPLGAGDGLERFLLGRRTADGVLAHDRAFAGLQADLIDQTVLVRLPPDGPLRQALSPVDVLPL